MATQPKIAIRAVKTLTGIPIARAEFTEKASSVFKMGALTFVDANGLLDECGADPALIIGVASRDGQNGTGKTQVVDLAVGGTLFRGYLDTSASEGTGVGVAGSIMKAYGVAKAATGGQWFVDVAETTADRVIVWQAWGEPGHVITDVRPHVLFSFAAATYQGNVGT